MFFIKKSKPRGIKDYRRRSSKTGAIRIQMERNMTYKDYDSVRKYLLDPDKNGTLTLGNNKQAVSFEQVFVTERCNTLYCILHPITPIEGLDPQAALVFEVGRDGVFSVCKDKNSADKIFTEYYGALRMAQKEKQI